MDWNGWGRSLTIGSSGLVCASALLDAGVRPDLCLHPLSLHPNFHQHMVEQVEQAVASGGHRVDSHVPLDFDLSMHARLPFLGSSDAGPLHQSETVLHTFRHHHHALDHRIVLPPNPNRLAPAIVDDA